MIGIRCFPPSSLQRTSPVCSETLSLPACFSQASLQKQVAPMVKSHRSCSLCAVKAKRNRLVSHPSPPTHSGPSAALLPSSLCHCVTVTFLWPQATFLLAQQGTRAKHFESCLLSLQPGPGKPREGAWEGRMLSVSHLEDRLESARFRTSGVSSDVGTGGEPPNSDLLSLSDAVSPSSLFSDSDSCKLKRDKELY